MRILGYWLRRPIAHCLVVLLAFPFAATAQEVSGQSAAAPAQAQGAPQSTTTPDAPAPAAPPTTTQSPAAAQSTTPQTQPGTTAPVGTAAAPYEKGVGVAASRPAGAVIAPAKQRRTRSILIRVGLIAAAAVAIGTVVALSSASPSTPHSSISQK